MTNVTRDRTVTFHVETLSVCVDPADLFHLFAGRPGLFFLDSGRRDRSTGRYSYLGFDPYSTLSYRNGVARIVNRHAARNFECDPFDLLPDGGRLTGAPGDVPFPGGAVGYLAYDLGRYVESLPSATFDDLLLPELRLGLYDRIIAVDHETEKTMVIVSNAGGRNDLERRAVKLANEIAHAAPAPTLAPPPAAPRPKPNFTRADYERMVRAAIDYIAAGDIFQVNLAQRFEMELRDDPHTLYRRLREASPGDFAAYFDAGDFHLISSSPERFLLRRGRAVETRPIKGTRPRRTGDRDEAMRNELLESEKDNAELAMIVDLERNDLGRVCEWGSVEVAEARRLDSYATVHHLSAVVRGRLTEQCTTADLLRATFPGGSITGAPKVRAMEIIEEMEPVRRGVYTGAIGCFGFDGSLDLNIAIRTLVAKDGMGYYSAGGGIVYDSKPPEEYDETLAKAKGLMTALGMAWQ